MPNFDPISAIRPTMPAPASVEPAHKNRSLISDSLGSMEGNPGPVWTPERPTLMTPDSLPIFNGTSSEYRLLAATEESRNLGDTIIDTLGVRLQNIKLKIREISADNIQKLKENAKRASESGFWSILRKIATSLLAAMSLVFGIALVASGGGALIGGAMIASGILSLANFAMSETGAWDWVVKQLSGDNEERRKMLAMALPGAVGIIAGGIGLVGSVQGIVSGALQFTEKAIYVAQSALAIFEGITIFGKGQADARLIWSKAELSEIEADLTVERTNFDSVMKEIEGSMGDFRAIKAKTKKMIQTLSQSNVQLVRQA
ncbi:MAG: hypothetical protein WA347_08995 [Rhabdochlamydiaceae bacterium]|jgi:hypothetical protein